MSSEQPLSPYRVLEIASGAGAFCGRVLADLGADVVKLEPPSGDPMRRQPPLAGDTGIAFLWYNANKRGLTLDLDDPACQERVAGALADFDILIDGNPPGWLATRGLGPADLRGRHPHLIVTSVTHFGQDGPYRDWHGSSLVDFAIAGSLLRCGVPEAPPCAPPYELSYAITGITAASATLLALFERGRSGDGDWIDCSVVEAVQAQGDWSVPNYGASGATQKRAGAGPLFRLYRAADGWVRVINLSPKQWRSFRAWLGDPPEIAGPEWENPLYRGANQSILDEICNRKFAGRTKADLFFDGQRAGVGIVPIYDPAEVMADAHFRERGTFVPFATPAGEARAPGAFVRMADHPPGSPRPAPSPGSDESVLAGPRAAAGGQGGDGRLPLGGLRIIEVGSGAVAPEITRILGEFGADVIKLESMMQVDFMRLMGQPGSVEASPGYASSNRSKRSVALNLKHPEANRLAQALADKADVIVENNTAGVMSRLGLDYPTLAARNPRLIYLSSQAFGATGPASSFGGFGPTNQAISATTYLWNHPDCDEPQGTQVIHPDHLLGRMGSAAVLAALDELRRSGRGQHIDLGQAELAMAAIGEAFIETSLMGGPAPMRGNRSPVGAPHGVFPSMGDDAWIAITVENDAQWCALKSVVGNPDWDMPEYDTIEGRLQHRDVIEAELAAWTAMMTNVGAMKRLQAAGVPAGAALSTPQVLADVHFHERDFFQTITHPVLHAIRYEGVPFRAERLRWEEPPRRAPLFGEHTDDVLREWLSLSDGEIAAVREAGAFA